MNDPKLRALEAQKRTIRKLIELTNKGDIQAYRALLKIKDECEELVASVKRSIEAETRRNSPKKTKGASGSRSNSDLVEQSVSTPVQSRKQLKNLRPVECEICHKRIPKGAMRKHFEARHRHLYYRYYGSEHSERGRTPSVPESSTREDIYDVLRVCQGGAPGLGKKK